MEPTVIPTTAVVTRRNPDPVVAIVAHRDVTLDDIKAYRREHGCSLADAMKALGWKGNRFVRLSEVPS